jgi:hypothetical protein
MQKPSRTEQIAAWDIQENNAGAIEFSLMGQKTAKKKRSQKVWHQTLSGLGCL